MAAHGSSRVAAWLAALTCAVVAWPAVAVDRPTTKDAAAKPGKRPGASKSDAAPADTARPGAKADTSAEPANTSSSKGDPALAALIASLRQALDASRKANEDPDLTTTLLSGIAEVSLVSAIHGHYALAGVGQALRTGGMPAADVAVVARDMERNFEQLAQTYGRLAGQKSFHPQLVDIFRGLQILCGKAQSTAGALAFWADASADTGRVRAFESALDDYRGRVKALFASLSR